MDTGEPPHIILLLISLLALFLLSMFFSSAETAFLSLNKLKLRFLRERNNRAAARAEKILQNKQKFLSTILIGNSIVNIAISVVLTAATLRIFGDSGLGIAVAAGTVLLLIFGEILPKSIALVYPDALSLVFARFILLLMAILSPVVALFSAITDVLLRLCGIREAQNTAAVTEADLREFFQAREEGGFIGSDERMLLTNILRYGDFSVRSVMTPRRDITAIHIGSSAEEIIELAKKSRFSRFPVYSTNIDAIQGFFYIKDFLFSPEYLDGSAAFQVSAYLRKPLFVFETTKLAQAEKKFHTEQQTMAIVLDEYGGTAGLITVEDVSEEIFGSILDEYDVRETVVPADAAVQAGTARQTDTVAKAAGAAGEEVGVVQPLQPGQTAEPANIDTAEAGKDTYSTVAGVNIRADTAETVQAGAGDAGTAHDEGEVADVFSIAGITRLGDLNEKLNLNLESQYSDTIGGYIMEKAGEIPAAGYSITAEPYLFTVTKVEANRIVQIEVRMQAEE
ncbi:hemolysin family protein [Treponema sp. OMZ 855]|uniref:hemolysin family protein n=1 Tax=Treponema sp. OMZ 855 TaxID=1643512 RepID=UPI0020A5F5A2|nr:hemolysin family protein [Treponema sp. OMZ 855]UTC50919.1 HlyC/CorC family transporter [Treponema sp. OMZ 855]